MKKYFLMLSVLVSLTMGFVFYGVGKNVVYAANQGWYCIYCAEVRPSSSFKPNPGNCPVGPSGSKQHSWNQIYNPRHWSCVLCGKKTITNGGTPGRGQCRNPSSPHNWR